jgi:hypothetical protein
VLALGLLVAPSLASAHPAPFSYLDLRVGGDVIEGTLVVHIIDVAHDLDIATPEKLLERSAAYGNLDRLTALLAQRLSLVADGQPLSIQWGDVDTIPERQGLQLHFRVHTPRPATLGVRAVMFPYDRLHQTFVNIYEDERLRQQFVLAVDNPERTYYTGTTQGALAVIKTFVPAGIHHILIGTRPHSFSHRAVAARRRLEGAAQDRHRVHHWPQHHTVACGAECRHTAAEHH